MDEYDVIVVGGGPGGSSAATFVAQAGHKVLLLEKESFPRHQIGESLLPATIQGICKILGVKDAVDAASFAPKRGGTFLWGKAKTPWTFLFERTARPTAYQVERSKFDDILLNNAKKHGVTVLHNCKAQDIIMDNNRVTGVKYKDKDNRTVIVKSKYLIDSSGHNSPLYHHVGKRIHSDFFRNVAVYGYFNGGKRLPSPNEGNILCAAFKHGWIWYIPLASDLTSVGIVVDHDVFLNKSESNENFFHNNLFSCDMIREYLKNAELSKSNPYNVLRIRKDFSYTTTKLWIPGMAIIGDAACFVDPLFSSGVHLSTLSALFAARSINTYLKGTVSEEESFQEFETRYRKEYGNFYNFLLAFYDFDQSEDDYYWAARKIINTNESGNEAFIKLVSGYSTIDNQSPLNSHANFFEDRVGLGNSFEKFFTGSETQNINSQNIDVSKFMKGFTQEITNIQSQAIGYNPEILLKVKDNLITSPDMLHWTKSYVE